MDVKTLIWYCGNRVCVQLKKNITKIILLIFGIQEDIPMMSYMMLNMESKWESQTVDVMMAKPVCMWIGTKIRWITLVLIPQHLSYPTKMSSPYYIVIMYQIIFYQVRHWNTLFSMVLFFHLEKSSSFRTSLYVWKNRI